MLIKSGLLVAIPLFLSTLIPHHPDSSLTQPKKNTIFVTFGGRENFCSINYERIFSSRKRMNWSCSIGVQPFNLQDKFSIPASLSAFTQGSLHHLEGMLTATFHVNKYHPWNGGWSDNLNSQIYLSPFICYRLQKSKGVMFKTGVGPQMILDPRSDHPLKMRTRFLDPSAFASLGYSF